VAADTGERLSRIKYCWFERFAKIVWAGAVASRFEQVVAGDDLATCAAPPAWQGYRPTELGLTWQLALPSVGFIEFVEFVEFMGTGDTIEIQWRQGEFVEFIESGDTTETGGDSVEIRWSPSL
jgi:hypothetical protein